MIGMPKSMMWDAELPLGPALKVVKVEIPTLNPVKSVRSNLSSIPTYEFQKAAKRMADARLDAIKNIKVRKYYAPSLQWDKSDYASENRVPSPPVRLLCDKSDYSGTNGLIEWCGGYCPVPAGTSVRLLLRNGTQCIFEDAADPKINWYHYDIETDIIGYLAVPKIISKGYYEQITDDEGDEW